MRILKLLTATTTLCVVAWFTSGQSLHASEKIKNITDILTSHTK